MLQKSFRHLLNQSVLNNYLVYVKKKKKGIRTQCKLKLIERHFEGSRSVFEPYNQNYMLRHSENIARLKK